MKHSVLGFGPACVIASAWLSAAACAQTPGPSAPPAAAPSGFVATPLHVAPVTGDDARESVLINATFLPGASTPVHRHPGDCIGTVVEGTIEMRIPGQEPRRYSAGQAYNNPRGVVHQLVNVGGTPARVLNTLLVDKGKPRSEAATPGQ